MIHAPMRAPTVFLLLVVTVPPALANVTVRNFTPGGAQVVRFDTAGNAIDAHDGMIVQVGSTFYLYGTSYGCGFVWMTKSPWCGFRVYSSTDLINWTNLGTLFDPLTATWQTRCGSCFRPHVIYNAANNNYILWINTTDPGAKGYRVFSSSSPAGPFTEQAVPDMGNNIVKGDFALFVDDGNAGYIAYRSFDNGLMGDIYVQALTSDYLNVTGPATSIGANVGGGGEAPAMFKKGRTYYITYSPLCPFCNGVPTVYKTASRPLGPWSEYTQISSTSCGGQASFVSKLTINSATVYLYGADLWRSGGAAPPRSTSSVVTWEPRSFGFFNQGQANFFWIPLEFSGTAINTLACDAAFTAALTTNPPALEATVDQSSGQDLFQQYCTSGSLDSSHHRVQTFVPARSGTLKDIRFTTYQGPTSCNAASCTPPNADLNVDLVTVDATGKPSGVLHAATVARGTIPWSPTVMTIPMNVSIKAGSIYGIHVYSATTTGCYGLAYADSNAYVPGKEYVSTDSGETYSFEPGRVLKFQDLYP
jgi:hypothetical protein